MASKTEKSQSVTIITKTLMSNVCKEKLSKYTKACIFGKGPTFQVLDKSEHPDTFFICVNDTIAHLDKCDMFALNDVESAQRQKNEHFSKCDFILVPNFPHKNNQFTHNSRYTHVVDIVKPAFKGSVFVYNLNTAPNDNKYINLDTAMSTSVNALDFVCKHCENVSHIDFYGVAKGIKKNQDGKKDAGVSFYKGRESAEKTHEIHRTLYERNIKHICNKFKKTYTLY